MTPSPKPSPFSNSEAYRRVLRTVRRLREAGIEETPDGVRRLALQGVEKLLVTRTSSSLTTENATETMARIDQLLDFRGM